MIITFNQAYEKYFKGLIGINKLRELVRTGKIPVVDIPSAKTYFNSDEIEVWLKRKKNPQQAPPTVEEYGKLRKIAE